MRIYDKIEYFMTKNKIGLQFSLKSIHICIFEKYSVNVSMKTVCLT